MKGAILTGILAFVFCLVGGIRCGALHKQYQNRLWLDERLSMAAQQALELETGGQLYPEPVWEHFLLGAEKVGKEQNLSFPAAFLTETDGWYQYDRFHGWSELISWEEDRVRQITLWLEECLKEDAISSAAGIPYEVRFPYSCAETWAEEIADFSLVVLYEGSGRRQIDTCYYRMAVGGAKRVKRTAWLVERQEGKEAIYHRESCGQLWKEPETEERKLEFYYSMEDCVRAGALPCPVCTGK